MPRSITAIATIQGVEKEKFMNMYMSTITERRGIPEPKLLRLTESRSKAAGEMDVNHR